MIAATRGEIIEIGKDNLVIFVSGIGFRVFVPKNTQTQAHVGDSVFLRTHLVVREDALILFGFEKVYSDRERMAT